MSTLQRTQNVSITQKQIINIVYKEIIVIYFNSKRKQIPEIGYTGEGLVSVMAAFAFK